jgi:hypothetical protein
MPLDTSIPLQVKPPQFDSPFEVQAKALQMKDMMGRSQLAEMQLGQQRDAMARQQTLRDLYKGMPAGAKESDIIGRLRGGGFHDEAEKLETATLTRDKTRSEIDAKQFETLKKRLDLVGGSLSSLLARPQVTHQDVIGQLSYLVNQGVITPEQGAEEARKLPGDPAQLRSMLMQKALDTLEAGKRVELLTPKTGTVDGGNRQVFTSTNPLTGQVATTGEVQKAPEGFTIGPNGQLVADKGWLGAKQSIASAGKTSVVVNAEKPLINTIAEGLGKQLDNSLSGATSAQSTIANARQLRELVQSGKVISGPGADLRINALRIGETLGVTGKDTQEKLANTAIAIQNLAKGELAAAEQMKGQGAITDSEREIIRRAAAGQINMSGPELLALSTAMEKVGTGKIAAHQQQVGRLKGVKGFEPLASFYGAPEVPPAAPAAAPQAQPAAPAWQSAYKSQAEAVSDARNAIQQGADKAAVIKRLEQAGITNHGIK